MDILEKAVPFYGVLINIIGFGLMGIDKQKARKHQWRISEKTLFLTALLFGSLGTWAGMYVFRHKTKHWYFVIGMPLILAVQVMILIMLFRWM